MTVQSDPNLVVTNDCYIQLDRLGDVTGKRPSQFRLPDGTVITVKRWKDVLRESCKFVLARHSDIPIPLKDRAGKKVWLFSKIKPATGVSYIAEEYKGQTIFIYVNYDANHCVSNALYVLNMAPQSVNLTTAAVTIADELTEIRSIPKEGVTQ